MYRYAILNSTKETSTQKFTKEFQNNHHPGDDEKVIG